MKIKSKLNQIFLDLYNKLFPKPEEPVIDTLPKFKVNDDIWVLGTNCVDAGKIIDIIPGNRYVVWKCKNNHSYYDLYSENMIVKRTYPKGNKECV